jgi:hypothetical protein
MPDPNCRELAEEPPRQTRVVGEDDPLSDRNHGRYITISGVHDNEAPKWKRGRCRPLGAAMRAAYSFAAASALSPPPWPVPSLMRAFLPRNPRR